MIDFIFTLDYEIYGNGTGALSDLVYEPARRLKDVFHKWGACFVNFVEVAEFEKIEACGTDAAIELVRKQVRELYREGFEIALHLHPQWCNARYRDGRWLLDFSEYNLCTLPKNRIATIVEDSLDYLRHIIDEPRFTPLSFRAGNWLFQPTQPAASVLAQNGIKVDSSVFKGGLQHKHGLDYRAALNNGYYWSFNQSANQPDTAGECIEVPIYTEMVPIWRMATSKRLGFGKNFGTAGQERNGKLDRLRDFLRFQCPLKLDFCRMTLGELTSMVERVIRKDRDEPELYRPLVAIGHTKDLVDLQTVDDFLSFLCSKGIAVSTFADIYPRLIAEVSGRQKSKIFGKLDASPVIT
jgi:hypothetical protein